MTAGKGLSQADLKSICNIMGVPGLHTPDITDILSEQYRTSGYNCSYNYNGNITHITTAFCLQSIKTYLFHWRYYIQTI